MEAIIAQETSKWVQFARLPAIILQRMNWTHQIIRDYYAIKLLHGLDLPVQHVNVSYLGVLVSISFEQ